MDREQLADVVVSSFERLIASKWLDRLTKAFLIFFWGWLFGYLQFRFQIGF